MRRILIVDDSALVRNSIQAALERFGFEFGHADTGAVGTRRFASIPGTTTARGALRTLGAGARRAAAADTVRGARAGRRTFAALHRFDELQEQLHDLHQQFLELARLATGAVRAGRAA